jgi:drug/metabolite transporter (DMT)-like permease
MLDRRQTAALLAIASVACFAGTGYFQQGLTAFFSVPVILALRILVGGCLLFLWVVWHWRFHPEVFFAKLFWIWTFFFITTVIAYGYAFTGRSLADVYLIVAVVPLLVIGLEWAFDGSSIEAGLWPPIGTMVFFAVLPILYRILFKGLPGPPLWSLWFALAGAAAHAGWLRYGGAMRKQHPQDNESALAVMYKFLFSGAVIYLVSIWPAAIKAEEHLREKHFGRQFFYQAFPWERRDLLLAGLCTALTVMLITKALKYDKASRLAPYQNLIAIWGVVIVLFLPTPIPTPPDEIGIMGFSAVAIAVAAWILYRRRMQAPVNEAQ